MKAKQLGFSNTSGDFKDYWKDTGRKVHGGVYSKGKRKTQRPFDSKKPLHLVMRSLRAKGSFSMSSPLNKHKVDSIIHEYAKQNGVTVYDYSNSGNHLHLSIKAPTRWQFQKYLRTIAGFNSKTDNKG